MYRKRQLLFFQEQSSLNVSKLKPTGKLEAYPASSIEEPISVKTEETLKRAEQKFKLKNKSSG